MQLRSHNQRAAITNIISTVGIKILKLLFFYIIILMLFVDIHIGPNIVISKQSI